MQQTMAADRRTVWVKEATHRAANLELLASNLQRLIDHGQFASDNAPETIRRASTLAKTYRSLHMPDSRGPRPCVQELKNIAYGLIAIFRPSIGSVMLSLHLQPLMLAGEERRALLLVASELVMNAMRHAFVGRQSGALWVTLHLDQTSEEGVLTVADDGIGPDGIATGAGHGHGIVHGLADVLAGAVTWRRSLVLGGTEAVLRLPVPIPAFGLAPTALGNIRGT
jgi:two-component sensor histidine kinase